MPRPKQTEAEREAMRTRILDAAHALLLEQGPDAISIRAIAERVGVSHMVLYTYFESHDALSRALRTRSRAWRTAMHAEQLHQAEVGDVVAVMREALAHYAARAREHPRMYKFMWVQIDTNVTHASTMCHIPRCPFQANVQHLAQLIQIGITRGVFVGRVPTLAAATVFSIIHAPLLLYHNGRLADETLREQMSAEVMEIAMGYLRHQT